MQDAARQKSTAFEVTFRHLLPDEDTVDRARALVSRHDGKWRFLFEKKPSGRIEGHANATTKRGELAVRAHGRTLLRARDELFRIVALEAPRRPDIKQTA